MESFDKINLDAIKAEFQSMQDAGPQVKSKKDLVAEMAGEIKDLLKMGYTLKQVLEVLQKNGMELKESTLKNYLSRSKIEAGLAASRSDQQTHPARPAARAEKDKALAVNPFKLATGQTVEERRSSLKEALDELTLDQLMATKRQAKLDFKASKMKKGELVDAIVMAVMDGSSKPNPIPSQSARPLDHPRQAAAETVPDGSIEIKSDEV